MSAQGKNFCQKLVMGQNIRTISDLLESSDASLTLPEGEFDGVLTPKTPQMTLRQGKTDAGRNMAIPGPKYGTRDPCPINAPAP